MDFFKNCKTNVQIIKSLSLVNYTLFRLQEEDDEEADTTLQLGVHNLRKRDILCATLGRDLVAFEIATSSNGEDTSSISDAADALPRGFLEIGNGSLEEPLLEEGHDTANLEASLYVAIEDAMTGKLQREFDIFRIGPFTWLYQNDDALCDHSLRLRLDLQTSHGGAVYTAISISKVIAQRADRLEPLVDVILAPFGRPANLLLPNCSSSELADHDELIISWKSLVVNAVRNAKAHVHPSEPWCLVRLHNQPSQQCMLWPRHLAISVKKISSTSPRLETTQDWLNDAHEDPWDVAEEWRRGAEERELAIKARTLSSEPPVAESMQGLPPGLENVPVASPAFVQRTAEQYLPASGIYPTPPDGLVPTSQPQPFAMDSVLATSSNEVNDAIDDYLPGAGDAREHSMASIDGPRALPSSNSDLFGDNVGEIDFAGGEVGDADFSFFDEPDEMSISHSMTHTPMDVEPNNTQTPIPDSRVDALATEITTENAHTDDEMHDQHAEDEIRNKNSQTTLNGPTDELNTDEEKDVLTKEKPLSPFGIRERLLPPPIPASIAQSLDMHDVQSTRRSSTFDPIVFRDSMSLVEKYSGVRFTRSPVGTGPGTNDISLPRRYKRSRFRPVTSPRTYTTNTTLSDGESSDGSSESLQMSDDEHSAGLAGLSKKRKRISESGSFLADHANAAHSTKADRNDSSHPALISLDFGRLMLSDVDADEVEIFRHPVIANRQVSREHDENLDIFNLEKLEIVMTAQLASAQEMSCLSGILFEKAQTETDVLATFPGQALLQHRLESSLRLTVPSASVCDISDLVIAREAAPARAPMSAGLPRPGQPRPPQRNENINVGPDIFVMPIPYVRTSRGPDMYELLPIALTFWEVLSLGPANGVKDIRAFGVVPAKSTLPSLLDDFLADLSTAYEGCKLGTHTHKRTIDTANGLDDYENGLAVVELDKGDSVADILNAYAHTCSELGRFLASIADVDAQRTMVIYLVDIFQCQASKQWLSAAFWLLYRSYCDNIPKTKKSLPHSDLVLQILPRSLLPTRDSMVILEPSQLARLAREVYDRCPPSMTAAVGHTSPLPNFAAPSVELANAPPKRIGFQLAADPPSDLLHEGSNLHVACCVSDDSQWLCAAWTDNTGRYSSTVTHCLRGTSLNAALEDVWARTRDIMLARDVFWRIYIVAIESLDEAVVAAWRKIIETPRKQAFSVTLLSVELDPCLKLRVPGTASDEPFSAGAVASTAALWTPVTTPQANSSITASPDTNGQFNAPPTPAPSELTTTTIEQDPDTHLVDLTEDAWAVVLRAKFAHVMFPQRAIVSGLLFKRGEAGLENAVRPSDDTLPSLGIHLMWTVQVRPTGHVDEGNLKHAEITMREVLRLYRNLSILTKARGWTISGDGAEIVPVHVMAAMKGARAVNGLVK